MAKELVNVEHPLFNTPLYKVLPLMAYLSQYKCGRWCISNCYVFCCCCCKPKQKKDDDDDLPEDQNKQDKATVEESELLIQPGEENIREKIQNESIVSLAQTTEGRDSITSSQLLNQNLPEEEAAFKEAVRKWQTEGKTDGDFKGIIEAVGNLKDLQKEKVDRRANRKTGMAKKLAQLMTDLDNKNGEEGSESGD